MTMALTVIEIEPVAEPAPFVAVTVYEAELDATVGVPLMTQVALMTRPAGSAGLVVQLVGVPPVRVGVMLAAV
jgi:hypothetical protein